MKRSRHTPATLFHAVLCAGLGAVVCGGMDEARADDVAAPQEAGLRWETDFAAARKQAAAGKRDLFLSFTGSDWCGFCIALREQVLVKQAFLRGAGEHFVLVELDYPRHASLPRELAAQNARMRVEFGIEGFPTLLLADCDGRVYGRIPSQPGITPEQLVAQMNALRGLREKRDLLIGEADALQGLKRAEKLHEAMELLDARIVERFHGATVDEIIALDEKDTLKRRENREFAGTLHALEQEIDALERRGDLGAIAAAIDAAIEVGQLKGERRQRVLLLKLGLHGGDQLEEALALLDTIIDIKADSAAGREAAEIRMRVAQLSQQRRAAAQAEADACP